MAFCSNCGNDIGDAKFCPYCGAPASWRDKRGEATSVRTVVVTKTVSSASYNEIAFAGNTFYSRTSRVTLFFATLLCTVFAGVSVYLAAKSNYGGYEDIFKILMFLDTGFPAILYGVIYCLTHIKKAFGKINGNTSMYALYKMQKFQISQIPIIILGIIALIVGFFIPVAKVSGTFGGIGYAFTEPELVDLAIGSGSANQVVFGLAFLFVYALYIFFVIYCTGRIKIIWRYFKGKIAPQEQTPKGVKKKKLIDNYPWLDTALGARYELAVKPYTSVRYRDKKGGYNVNAEPNYIKYTLFSIAKPLILVAVFMALIITYCAIVPSHLSQRVRIGKAAQINMGYTHEQVKNILGEPSERSTLTEYIYMWDNIDIDDIDNIEDLDNVFNKEFTQLTIVVYFDFDEIMKTYNVAQVLYDTEYITGNSFLDSNLKKEITVKNGKLKFYKNGSMSIE